MQKTLLFLFLVVAIFSANTILHAQQNTPYDKLVHVNKEWQNQPGIDPELKHENAIRLNEQQLIQFHLAETEKLLRTRNVKNLSASQLQNRSQNLDVLHQYMQAGLFPINTIHVGRQPYFIDDYGTYCAVGYLMKMSGADEMAKDIHKTQNYNYLADIQHPDLMKWVERSGLSFDELALIQPGYAGGWPPAIMELHYKNTGTDVNEYIEVHQNTFPYFNKILFYNEEGTLYKTLPIAQMLPINGGQAYYYLFPSNESFADKGMIVLKGNGILISDTIISETVYNDTSVHEKFYTSYPANFYERHYSIGENETTPINTSLTFCGTYFTGTCYICGAFINNTWNLHRMPITIGTINPCTIMPIGLGEFSYALNKNTVDLKWQTSSESNNDHFEIQRSTDGTNFTTIGKVKGAGTTNEIRNYNFTDKDPQYSNHYRLKQVDFDGKFSYSKILFVKFSYANLLSITENPVRNVLQLQVNNSRFNAGQITIYDLFGRTIKSFAGKGGKQSVDVSSLSAGKYLIRMITSDGQVFSSQFMKL